MLLHTHTLIAAATQQPILKDLGQVFYIIIIYGVRVQVIIIKALCMYKCVKNKMRSFAGR